MSIHATCAKKNTEQSRLRKLYMASLYRPLSSCYPSSCYTQI